MLNSNLKLFRSITSTLRVYEKFHRNTQIKQQRSLLLKPDKWPLEWKTIQYKAYARFPILHLLSPKPIINTFSDVLFQRHSRRSFSSKKISLRNLSDLLYYSAGLKTKKINKHVGRFYPSAGARYPLELYIVSLNSQLPRALYHYYPKEHGLEKMWLYNENQIALCFDQDWIKKASIILLISAVFKRTTTKYGDRGYRHVLIESGHMGQNIYLISSALNLSCCSIGGFFDLKLNRLLEVDGVEEAIIYAFAIGHAL